jgi:hypothetical protein
LARALITSAPPRVGSRGPAGARSTGRRWAVLLVAGWLCQAGLRAWFGRMQVMPLANPDESAYLIAARVLAGGPDIDLSGSTLYQGGYPLLITPVYWFTSNPVTIYHAVLLINAAISAAVLPLGYLACRRLGLDRPAAYGLATVAALVPAGFFYSEYAMTDAVYPVITLAWLLATHSWLTASSARGRYAAAAGSAALTGYAYAIHSRGLVMLAGYAAVGAFIAWRRPVARGSVAAAALTAMVTAGGGWILNRYVASAMYPEGTRSLSDQMRTRLASVHGTIHVFEMAAGQLWRLVLDSWGIAGIGLVAALAVIAHRGRGPGTDLRIMAGLSVAVTAVIGCTAPAALPSDHPQTWASGRYLDGMIIVFFLAGGVVLLRASVRSILACAACTAGLFVVAAVTVAIYAGSSLPTARFSGGFNFAEPAVLTQDWTQASVLLATAVTLGLLATWIGFALAARRRRAFLLAFWVCVAAVSLLAVAQMTSHVSQAATAQARTATALVSASGLKPGDQVAVDSGVSWELWVPQAFEIPWTELQFYDPASQPPPAGVTVVETLWPAGQPTQASWPHAPAGWRVVASDRDSGLVAWRKA